MFGLYPTDLKIPCQTFQCYGRAAYYLGKPDSPNGTVPYVCEDCAKELIEQIVQGADQPLAEDKPVSDWTVAELKEHAETKGLAVKSKMTKAELVHLIEDAHE